MLVRWVGPAASFMRPGDPDFGSPLERGCEREVSDSVGAQLLVDFGSAFEVVAGVSPSPIEAEKAEPLPEPKKARGRRA